MNVLPVIPQGAFALLPPSSSGQVARFRHDLAPLIRQMTHCRRCRADASGLLDEDGGSGCGGKAGQGCR